MVSGRERRAARRELENFRLLPKLETMSGDGDGMTDVRGGIDQTWKRLRERELQSHFRVELLHENATASVTASRTYVVHWLSSIAD